MTGLQAEPIRTAELIAAVRGEADGAVAVFLGTVRDHNLGRRVTCLEYHAYDAMARAELERLEQAALREFEVSRVALVHRIGRLEIGEVSVAVVVASPHRDAAFRACRWIIDTLKRTVPIWKKEFFDGGEVWIEGCDGCAGEDGPGEAGN
jgi:molybdopterin synthase catalytic subunit